MFSCHGCIASALRAVVETAPAHPLRVIHTPQHSFRNHNTINSRTTRSSTRSIQRYASTATKTAQSAVRHAQSANDNQHQDQHQGQQQGLGIQKRREVSFSRQNLVKELRFLGDPLKLANYVKTMLGQGNTAKAQELVRLAGREMSVTVSWNHLIAHAMSRGDVSGAWGLFNEMKKRGQKPDSYTYMQLFRGLAANAHVPSAAEKAISIYHSMTSPSSPLTPSLSHTNAVILVCAKAKQLDAMFSIAASLPSHGRGAADHVTFTTILNAIRVYAMDATLRFGKDGTQDTPEERYQEAIRNGERIWQDVISRWKDGTLTLDEELVCAMGRILLLSGTKDNRARSYEDMDKILSLLEQAMGIPRQIEKFKWSSRTPTRQLSAAGAETLVAMQDSTTMQRLDQGDADSPPANEMVWKSPQINEQLHKSVGDNWVFDPVMWKSSRPRAYAKPGNDTLSLAVTAAGYLHEFEAANKYWNLLTEVVVPDRENCHTYLRVLRLQRSSRYCLAILKQMRIPRHNKGFGVGVEPKSFRIAMSACARNPKDPNSLGTALEILQMMRLNLEIPDIMTVRRFVALLRVRGRDSSSREAMGSVEVLLNIMYELRDSMYYGNFSAPSSRRSDPAGELAVETAADGVANRLTLDSKRLLDELVILVESATTRTLDYYKEDLSAITKSHWHKKLGKLRKLMKPRQRSSARQQSAEASLLADEKDDLELTSSDR